MKSKSFDLKESPTEKSKHNKTFDFVGLYKPAAETNVKLLDKRKSSENSIKDNSSDLRKSTDTPKRERSPNKKKKKNKNELADISTITIDGQSLGNSVGRSSPVDHPRVASTPYATSKTQDRTPKVKSIMKSSSVTDDDALDYSNIDTPPCKPKKRNKSVSFMLDDTEEVAVKKTKSNESIKVSKNDLKSKSSKKSEFKKQRKIKKSHQDEKENNSNVNIEMDQNSLDVGDKKSKLKVDQTRSMNVDTAYDSPVLESQTVTLDRKRKVKKLKKLKKSDEGSKPTEDESNVNEEPPEPRVKKLKKKKRNAKLGKATESMELEGEPVTKSRKKDVKPDIIAEDLENLSIGDNAHTLTNLLDEMTVVDKEKKKKNKLRRKREKGTKSASVSSSETADLEKIEEGKEKVKWKKRKWNKDKKGEMTEDKLITSVIVENLPFAVMLNYKTLLTEHFGKLGLIKRVGIAEVFPAEDPKPVFTTTITFYSEGAATKALEEDNTKFQGHRIRVKRPLPATQTTLVVRSYADLSDQSLSSSFSGAGRIRSIRHLVKGRKAMSTAFIEFDGPETVERALKMAEDAKIGGKKMHVSKFEQRTFKHKEQKTKSKPESENEGDSENSND